MLIFPFFSFERFVPSEWYKKASNFKDNVSQDVMERIGRTNLSPALPTNRQIEESQSESTKSRDIIIEEIQ